MPPHLVSIIESYIEESLEEIKAKGPDHQGDGVLEKLLKIDKRIAVIMTLDMLMAGVDTTSNATLHLLYHLAKNPEKQAILRAEVMQKLPEKTSQLTPELMANMPYLRACFKEAFRLTPVLIGTMRRVADNITLNGFRIPKGTDVAFGQMTMYQEESLFKQPTEFIPERFLKNSPVPELKVQHPFAFLPFGFGPRMCIGKRFAELEIETLVAKLIRNYHIEYHYPKPNLKVTILNVPTGPLKFRFVEVE